jgi:hypothetical protein
MSAPVVASAQTSEPSAPRQTVSAAFTTDRVASSSGYLLSIDYFNPNDPAAKPFSVEGLVQRLAPGARVDTSVPELCLATDLELRTVGASACPPGSVIGGGEVEVDFGAPQGSFPRFVSFNVTFFNNDHQLIFYGESTNVVGVKLLTRAVVGEDSFTNHVPPVPGFGPPDNYMSIKRVRTHINNITNGPGRNYITTPRHCQQHHWTIATQVNYRDGTVQNAENPSACTPRMNGIDPGE